ncbi:MAG: pilus assembly protein PilP [Paracoccaceae bacterium]|nr:pilus assembly protein PilP [Paracoccaceae bacterium]
MKYSAVLVGIVIFLLAGCSERDEFLDIDNKLAEASLLQKVNVEPIPSFPQQSGYSYQSQAQRNPFQFVDEYLEVYSPPETEVAKPDLMRVKEPLELFDLPSLEMVGSLGKVGKLWGLVSDPTGTVSKVTVGDRLGKNFGQIIEVSQSELVLLEKISNERGIWFSQSRSILME